MASNLDIGALQSGTGRDIGALQSSGSTTTPVNKTATDSLSFTDAVVLGLISPALTLSLFDSLSFTDSPFIIQGDVLPVFETPSDSISFSDSISLSHGLAFLFVDSITLSDTIIQGSAVISVSLSDFILFLDDQGVPQSQVLNDFFVLTDMPNIHVPGHLSPGDTHTYLDSVSITLLDTDNSILISLSDGIITSDTNSLSTIGIPLVLADSIILSDGVFLFGADLLILNEQVILVDFAIANVPLSVNPAFNIAFDSFAFSDFVQLHMFVTTTPENLDELIGFGDSVNLALNWTIQLADSMNLSDAPQLFQPGSLSINDSLSLSDPAPLFGGAIVTEIVSDTLSLLDSVTVGFFGPPALLVSDSLFFSDSVNIQFTQMIQNYYLRRYLNDVSGIVPQPVQPGDSFTLSDQVTVHKS